jgi:hypothetical protein
MRKHNQLVLYHSILPVLHQPGCHGKRPVIFAAPSPHMEDIGTLQPLCADRSERLEVKNLAPAVATEFARREAERAGLWASNLEPARDAEDGHRPALSDG